MAGRVERELVTWEKNSVFATGCQSELYDVGRSQANLNSDDATRDHIIAQSILASPDVADFDTNIQHMFRYNFQSVHRGRMR